MKFVLAPDKYKGSLTGQEFCEAVASGILKVFPHAEIVKRPLADGGDGTIEVVSHYLNASTVPVRVHDPLFRELKRLIYFPKTSAPLLLKCPKPRATSCSKRLK